MNKKLTPIQWLREVLKLEKKKRNFVIFYVAYVDNKNIVGILLRQGVGYPTRKTVGYHIKDRCNTDNFTLTNILELNNKDFNSFTIE